MNKLVRSISLACMLCVTHNPCMKAEKSTLAHYSGRAAQYIVQNSVKLLENGCIRFWKADSRHKAIIILGTWAVLATCYIVDDCCKEDEKKDKKHNASIDFKQQSLLVRLIRFPITTCRSFREWLSKI